MELSKDWANIEQPFAYQTIIQNIVVHDPGYDKVRSIQDHFTVGSKVFMLANPYYGSMGEVKIIIFTLKLNDINKFLFESMSW